MGQDLANRLLEVVTDGLRNIQDQLCALKEEMSSLGQRYVQIQADCQICKTSIQARIESLVGRIEELELFRKAHNDQNDKREAFKWSAATRTIAALLSVIGMICGAVLNSYLGR